MPFTLDSDGQWEAEQIQSTLPAWGATRQRGGKLPRKLFQSTLPAWGATHAGFDPIHHRLFQSTLPAWGATVRGQLVVKSSDISIHAPRVGSDLAAQAVGAQPAISIHAPRVGSDLVVLAVRPRLSVFQSTLPAWGATPRPAPLHGADGHFNPRSPRGERHSAFTVGRFKDISIHTPRVGSDRSVSRQRRTVRSISIHAPRVGSDTRSSSRAASSGVFQSTLPAWGATLLSVISALEKAFQSTLPAWGATKLRLTASRCALISIHAPRVGSDHGQASSVSNRFIFQSTLPAWGATRSTCANGPAGDGFQSTLPAWGATIKGRLRLWRRSISIHAPRVGSDTGGRMVFLDAYYFNPRSPRGERHGKTILLCYHAAISIHAPRVGSDCSDSSVWLYTQ